MNTTRNSKPRFRASRRTHYALRFNRFTNDASQNITAAKTAGLRYIVNAYLKTIAGHEFAAKDFRTWAGTVLAARALREFAAVDSQAQAKRNVMRAIEAVAKRLGNTKTVCRKCYIHPDVLNAYLDGRLVASLNRKAGRELRSRLHDLPPEEAAVLTLLHHGLRRGTRVARA